MSLVPRADAAAPGTQHRRPPWLSALPAVGVGALVARPWVLPAGVAVEWRVAFFVALGLAGALVPLPPAAARPPAPLGPSLAALGAGALAFALGRAVVVVPAGPRHLATAVAVNALAAVAEEAFFRRHLYGTLVARHGDAFAVAATAAAFALVHVTV